MKPNQLAIIVAYYLSKYNTAGLKNLGFSTFNEAFRATAKALGVNKNYVKLRRDEFDYIFPWRRGWQRPMHKQIVRAMEALQDIDEPELREIVLNLLNNKTYRNSEEIEVIANAIKSDDKKEKGKKGEAVFILRGPTGEKAESYFIEYFNKHSLPISGKLTDTTNMGCGYDFEIENNQKKYFVEVKGLAKIQGGILFTDKEWKTAKKKGDSYFVAVVRNIEKLPSISFIQNPFKELIPKKNTYTKIHIGWSVSNKSLLNK